jgi:nucleotidyltransferase substrate binding protein (TIGR01987 family)
MGERASLRNLMIYGHFLQRDGFIQRYEFTFELAWKTVREKFLNEGLIGLNSPKSVMREAFSADLINDQALWLLMLEDRNATTHTYEESAAKEICYRIVRTHQAAFAELERKLEGQA